MLEVTSCDNRLFSFSILLISAVTNSISSGAPGCIPPVVGEAVGCILPVAVGEVEVAGAACRLTEAVAHCNQLDSAELGSSGCSCEQDSSVQGFPAAAAPVLGQTGPPGSGRLPQHTSSPSVESAADQSGGSDWAPEGERSPLSVPHTRFPVHYGRVQPVHLVQSELGLDIPYLVHVLVLSLYLAPLADFHLRLVPWLTGLLFLSFLLAFLSPFLLFPSGQELVVAGAQDKSREPAACLQPRDDQLQPGQSHQSVGFHWGRSWG